MTVYVDNGHHHGYLTCHGSDSYPRKQIILCKCGWESEQFDQGKAGNEAMDAALGAHCAEHGLYPVVRIHPFRRVCDGSPVVRRMFLPVTGEELQRHRDGSLAQDVWPSLPSDEREFIISGLTGAEWDEIPFEGNKGGWAYSKTL